MLSSLLLSQPGPELKPANSTFSTVNHSIIQPLKRSQPISDYLRGKIWEERRNGGNAGKEREESSFCHGGVRVGVTASY